MKSVKSHALFYTKHFTGLTWSSCLLKLLKRSCLLTWNTGFPSLKTACMTTPSEYISEAESQLTDRMYSGATYSGLGRQRGGRLGSHSLHTYLGYNAHQSFIQSDRLKMTCSNDKKIKKNKAETLSSVIKKANLCFCFPLAPNIKNNASLTSASDGLLEEMLKSKPMIFQAPLLFSMMFSRHRLPCTILTPLCRKDRPSDIWAEETRYTEETLFICCA